MWNAQREKHPKGSMSTKQSQVYDINTTKKEFQALQELCKDESVITKKADKADNGGATVLMDWVDCMQAYVQLADKTIYKIVTEDPTYKLKK